MTTDESIGSIHVNVERVGASPNGPKKKKAELENGTVIISILPSSKLSPCTSYNTFEVPTTIASNLFTITVEDYTSALQKATNNFWFRAYCICHQRIVCAWLVTSLLLMTLLIIVANLQGMVLFAFSMCWTLVICIGVAFTMMANKMLSKRIEYLFGEINRLLLPYDLLMCVDDRGKFVCDRVAIVVLKFSTANCLARIQSCLSSECQTLDVSRLSLDARENANQSSECSQDSAAALIAHYSQSYGRDLVRGVINFPQSSQRQRRDFLTPLHCRHAQCPCQYIERNYFSSKRKNLPPNPAIVP